MTEYDLSVARLEEMVRVAPALDKAGIGHACDAGLLAAMATELLALRTLSAAHGEAVAWQHRGKRNGDSVFGQWRDGRNQSYDTADGDDFEERRLYTLSPASLPLGVKSYWLIERTGFEGKPYPHWYAEDDKGWHGWTPVAVEAKQFPSLAAASAFPAYRMIAKDPTISLTEHITMGDDNRIDAKAGPIWGDISGLTDEEIKTWIDDLKSVPCQMALRELLAARQKGQVSVTLLEWDFRAEGFVRGEAECILGLYRIAKSGITGKWFWSLNALDGPWSLELPTCDAAKAAAQADFNTSILSALKPIEPERISEATWRDMSSAPKDGKHCILAVPEPGGFIYSVQGCWQEGQWNAVHRENVQPLYWMPNIRLPDRAALNGAV